jgi:hypothetical protein
MSDANRNIQLTDAHGMWFYENCVSRSSLKKPNGDLILRTNPHSYVRRQRTIKRYTDYTSQFSIKAVNGINYPLVTDDVTYQKAYSSFRKKIHQGDASLGVTAGSWKQSAAMLRQRLTNVNVLLNKVKRPSDAVDLVREMHRAPNGRGTSVAKAIANDNLEVEFGWKPLFSDVTSAIEVLGMDLPPAFITGQGRSYYESVLDIPSNREHHETFFHRRVRLSANVRLVNPNLWMLNRLGLLNPATVAWDLIPWSFVVGMFNNTAQILNSFTDWVGLEFIDYSRTNSLSGYGDYTVYSNWPLNTRFAYTRVVFRQKDRVLQVEPERPPLIWRCPDLSWSTVTMAASLAVQQSTRVLRLLEKGGKAAKALL